jgi:hypothetical protein
MENMANYILSVLKSSPIILMSWGAQLFKKLEDNKGLSMIVNGFIYQGKVSIIYNEGNDSFDVMIGNTEHNHIYVDMLVEFIDSAVEKNVNDEQYKKNVRNFYDRNLQ